MCIRDRRCSDRNSVSSGSSSSLSASSENNSKKSIYIATKTENDLHAWLDAIFAKCPLLSGVSSPTNFTHKVHVGFDPETGSFVGMPTNWEKLLKHSRITGEDWNNNSAAVIQVLQFYQEYNGAGNPTNTLEKSQSSEAASSQKSLPSSYNENKHSLNSKSSSGGSSGLTSQRQTSQPPNTKPQVSSGNGSLPPINTKVLNNQPNIPRHLQNVPNQQYNKMRNAHSPTNGQFPRGPMHSNHSQRSLQHQQQQQQQQYQQQQQHQQYACLLYTSRCV